MDDWQLLNNYATKRSEEAFRALVERYAGMVYHAALRQTGNPDSAEEAAQVVFIALAQKAGKISRQTTLYGWLFRATRFAVSNQARQNANRQRREQEALAMQSTMETNDADSLWERITPSLDDALEKLSASDRELLMIRFFGNKSHKDVAEALGVSEETARKRISRAIEKLRVIFSRQGVVVSSLALASAFAVHGAKAAPGDAVSSWTNVAMAKAAAGVGGTSAAGILSFEPAAMSPGVIAAVVGSVVVAAAVFIAVKYTYHNSPALAPSATNLANATGAPDAKAPSPAPETSPEPAKDTEANPVSAAALDKVKAALHDLNPTTRYPNSVMLEAIDGLGDKKKSAIPILEVALNDADFQVRLRAIDGLGAVGPQAKDAAPLLLDLLRASSSSDPIQRTEYTEFDSEPGSPKGVASMIYGIEADEMILYALGQIHAPPQILSEMAQIVKSNPAASRTLLATTSRFSKPRGPLLGGAWLWEIADRNPKVLNDAFRPLLQDTNAEVRRAVAASLANALGSEADPGVFPVALELLKSGDDNILRLEGLMILEHAATDLSPEGWTAFLRSVPSAPDGRPLPSSLNAPRLGRYLNKTVAVLAEVAKNTSREDLRLMSARMLDALSPDFRKYNPQNAAELDRQEEMQVFESKVQRRLATMPEILEGLKKYPEAAPGVAECFSGTGSNALEILPALADALTALGSSSPTNGPDRAAAVRARQRLANAMQKIAPDLPKPIFTQNDTIALTEVMLDPAMRSDPDRRQRVSEARKLAEWPHRGPFDVSPDEVRRLLAAVKEADAPTYDALIAKVKEIDPHFFDAPLQ